MIDNGRKKSAAAQAGAAAEQKTRLSSVTTAVRVLKAFTESEGELGISVLSKRLGVSKSTVHRIATTLLAEGLLEQNPETDRYRLGIGLFTLGTLVRQRMNVSAEAKPFVTQLRNAVNENVRLAVLQGTNVVYIYDLESTQSVRLRPHLGQTKPAFCSAEGRAILAFTPPEIVDDILAQPLKFRTNRTVVEPAQIYEGLRKVRAEGFAAEFEESEIGMHCVAAPVFDAEGRAVAAVGIAGPRQRFSQRTMNNLVPTLKQTAELISGRLGYQSHVPNYG